MDGTAQIFLWALETRSFRVFRSRYIVAGPSGPVGYTDLADLRQADGSRTCLVRERLEFWGPVLDRFVVLTFNAAGEFDTGHWVGSSEYSGDFRYSFHHDGRTIRGDWQGSALGVCSNHVPSRPSDAVIGFWGPLESLALARFDPSGRSRQIVPAVDVEDTHHRAMMIEVEKLGREEIDVPAGRFWTTKYRSERFGATHHWIDDSGTVIRWASENDTFRWDLERYPAETLSIDLLEEVARGTYRVSSPAPGPAGSLTWRIDRDAAGQIHLSGEERLNLRASRFTAILGPEGGWKSCSQECDWIVPEGQGSRETHYFETFFHREQLYLLRMRPNAYPLLQGQPTSGAHFFHLVNFPIASATWLGRLLKSSGNEQPLEGFIHLANRYRGACLEAPPRATANYSFDPMGRSLQGVRAAHHFALRYPGGWNNSRFECWTDNRLIPQKAVVEAAEGQIDYELVEYDLKLAERMPSFFAETNDG
jgi:hypothetical protein